MNNEQDQIETLLKEVSEQAEEIKELNSSIDEYIELLDVKNDEINVLNANLAGIENHIDDIRNIL